MLPIAPEDTGNKALIDGRRPVHDGGVRPAVFHIRDDRCLIGQGDLGVRNNGGRDEGMCPSADGAFDPADAQGKQPDTGLDPACIVAMDLQASGKAAGTGKLVELDVGEQLVIKILRYGVAKIIR